MKFKTKRLGIGRYWISIAFNINIRHRHRYGKWELSGEGVVEGRIRYCKSKKCEQFQWKDESYFTTEER